MKSNVKNNFDFYGTEMLDCSVCDNFSNATGDLVYKDTPEDYELLIDEYKKSGSEKSFNDWLASDSSKAKYIKSGSKKTFKEWINDDSNKNLIASLATLGATILQNKNIGKQDVLDKEEQVKKEQEREQQRDLKKTNWILISSIILGGIALSVGTYLLIKKAKK